MTSKSVSQNPQASNSTLKRDGYIDFFKGLLILWVIQIHTVFWSGTDYIADHFRQLSLLVDVTTFFFISGYLTKVTNFRDSSKKCAKQFKVLYLNYLGLSLVLIGPLSVLYYFKEGFLPDFSRSFFYMLTVLRLRGEGEVWTTLPVYRGSFWYLWVYLSLLVVLPLLISLCRTRRLRVGVLLSLLSLLYIFNELDLHIKFLLTETQSIFFYAFVFLLGLTYRAESHHISTRWIIYSLLANIVAALSILIYVDDWTLMLQPEKFPPSFEYLIYSLVLMHVFVLLQCILAYPSSENRHPSLRFLEWCGRNSYFIYLIQGFVTSIPYYFSESLIASQSVPIVYVIIFTFNVLATLFFTFVYIKVKDRVLGLFSKPLPA